MIKIQGDDSGCKDRRSRGCGSGEDQRGLPGETESAVSGGAQRLVYVHERPAEEDRFQLRNIVRETLFVLRYLLVGGCQVSDRTGQQHRRPGRDYRRGHCGYGRQHRTHGRGVEDEEARQYPRVYAFFKPKAYQRQIPIDYPAMHIGNEFIVGYGLDYDQLGRNYKDVYVVTE